LGIDAARDLAKDNHIIYDLKYVFPRDQVDLAL